jgi:hypothetical protein
VRPVLPAARSSHTARCWSVTWLHTLPPDGDVQGGNPPSGEVGRTSCGALITLLPSHCIDRF